MRSLAGADIAEMAPQSYVDVYVGGLFTEWQQMRTIRKPIIGAVAGKAFVTLFAIHVGVVWSAGFALGGMTAQIARANVESR
jgi:hypothetical protein